MTPALAIEVAIRVYSKRWAAFAFAMVGIGVFAACAAYGTPEVARLAAALVGPVVGVPWVIFCAASWFHPEYGSMVKLARRAPFLPDWLHLVVRWYGAVFSAFAVLFCAVVWPALTYSSW